MIRDARADDAVAVAAIYNHFVANSVVTFEIDSVTDEEMRSRIATVQAEGYPFVVWDESGEISGYAYASRFRDRAAYARSVESTIYLRPDAVGRGIGSALYRDLLERLRGADTHVVVALIALPNPASVGLHESLGFAPVGVFPEIGRKFDRWIDVGFWQLRLGD